MPNSRISRYLKTYPGDEGITWWDPRGEGLAVVGAYRAINSPGTPWLDGPTTYAASLINQANPGVLDLAENNGAVTWAAVSGWAFTAVGLQSFDTGIIPDTSQYSMIAQYSGIVAGAQAVVCGQAFIAGNEMALAPRWNAGTQVQYRWGSASTAVAPMLGTGNLCVTGGRGYRDGVVEGAVMAGGGGGVVSLYIGALNDGGVAALFFDGNVQAVAIYSGGISSSVTSLVTAMGQL